MAVVGYNKTGGVSATENGIILFGQGANAIWATSASFEYIPTGVALNDDGDVFIGTLEGRVILLSRTNG